jgi:two-component system, response regulator PdtaR
MTIGVLVVEDEFLVRMDAVDSIARAGFRVYEANNADEAIRILETNHNIRVVFTDINMPGSMDGLKLAHYVRGRWPPIKLIITSGHTLPAGEELPDGADYFAKPYQLEKVTRSIREIAA